MVAFGDHLRADDDVDLALGDAAHEFGGRRRADHGVAGRDHKARLGVIVDDLFSQALDTWTAGHQAVLAAAGGADGGPADGIAAMVTLQPAAQAMFHHPGRAAGTFVAMPAGPTQGQRRVATAVQKQ